MKPHTFTFFIEKLIFGNRKFVIGIFTAITIFMAYSATGLHIDAGFSKRIIWGTDHMQWPEAIGIAVESIETAQFLSEEQRKYIFYNNAARFLRFSDEEIARHYGISD